VRSSMALDRETVRRAIAYMEEALAFEEAAVKRYLDHIASIRHPHVNALLEGIVRTERGHMAELRARIEALKRQLGEDETR